MAVHQYIGARYVPYYYQNSLDPTSTEWEPNVNYEALTVVTLPNMHSYISKKFVPDTIGSPALNAEYWLDTGSDNAYIQALQDELDAFELSLDFIYVVQEDMTLTELNTALNDLPGKAIVVMKANVDATGGGSVDNNCGKVLGWGGYFLSTAGTAEVLTFPAKTEFKGTVKLFEKIVPKSADDVLLGECNNYMFGMDGTKNVDVQNEMDRMFASDFTNIHFYKGVFTAGFNNSKSDRTIRIDDGVIFDGILHLATSNDDNVIIKNTHVIGKIVTTLRVGTYNCLGVFVPDGIDLLDSDSSYDNQTALHGMNVGVHIYYNSREVHIGRIATPAVRHRTDGVYNAALIIDKDGSHAQASSIYIDEVEVANVVSANDSGVFCANVDHLYIKDIRISNSASPASIILSAVTYSRIDAVLVIYLTGAIGIRISDGCIVNFGTVVLYTTNMSAFAVAGGAGQNYITFEYVYTNGGSQGLRAIGDSHIIALAQRNTATAQVAVAENGTANIFNSL